MSDADKLVEDCARAIRRNRFERNGTMLKAYDPTIPLTEGELADGRAAIALAVERCAEVARNFGSRDSVDIRNAIRSLSPNAKGET